MNNLLLLVLLFSIATGCTSRNKIFNDRNLAHISVEVNYTDTLHARKWEISQPDSLASIVEHFNSATRQPMKFAPNYKISLIYSDSSVMTILALGSLIKYDGLTYILNERIEQIVGE